MDDIYLHTSNFESRKNLEKLPGFKRTFYYDMQDLMRMLPNEWGGIKKDDVFFHFLVGRFASKLHANCHYCDTECIEKESDGSPQCLEKWLMCPNCKSRGPSLFFAKCSSADDKEHYASLLIQRYNQILQWDNDLVGVNG